MSPAQPRVRLGAAVLSIACVAFAGAWSCKDEPTVTVQPKDSGGAPPPTGLVQDGSLPMMPTWAGLFGDADIDGWPTGILGLRASTVPRDLVVDMVHDNCAGSCRGDIHLDAEGKGTLKRQGKVLPLSIEPGILGSLVTAIDSARFFDMKPDYGSGAPVVTITVTMNGKTKKVRHSYGDIIAIASKVIGPDASQPALFTEERQRLLDLQNQINLAANTGNPDALQFPESGAKALEKLFKASYDASPGRDAR